MWDVDDLERRSRLRDPVGAVVPAREAWAPVEGEDGDGIRQRHGDDCRGERRRAARRDAVEPAASAPSLGASAAPASRPEKNRAKKSGTTNPADDFSDVEAILKKHGI